MFLGLVNESFWIKKKNQVKDNASCGNEIRCNSFPLLFGSIGRKEHVSWFG